MVVSSPPSTTNRWKSLSFVSTLYLSPVLDLIVADVPEIWHCEVRLGLQEALVNAAKHGNNLDPSKQVSVEFTRSGRWFWWVIADQGSGFTHPCGCQTIPCHEDFTQVGECGRGLYILYQIFDEVQWGQGGRQLRLSKHIRPGQGSPLVV